MPGQFSGHVGVTDLMCSLARLPEGMLAQNSERNDPLKVLLTIQVELRLVGRLMIN